MPRKFSCPGPPITLFTEWEHELNHFTIRDTHPLQFLRQFYCLISWFHHVAQVGLKCATVFSPLPREHQNQKRPPTPGTAPFT